MWMEFYMDKNREMYLIFDPGVLKDDDGRIYLYTGLSYLKDAPMRKYLAGMFQIDGSYCVELDKGYADTKRAIL